MSRIYKNKLNLRNKSFGNERRKNLAKEILKDSTPLPKTLLYKDIDEEFKKWVENDLNISFEDETIPTIGLFSNQRFSEYMQSWSNVDNKKNLILNFKTITRENNPKTGTLLGNTKNIPGEYKMLLKTVEAYDKNNRKYYIDYFLKQPFTVDIIYTVTLVTNKYELLNEFNLMLNDKFKAINCYIRPNGHYIPMKLNDVSDESEYNIDNRQFYSQSFNITVMAYIIKEDDYIVSERGEFKFLGFEGERKTYAEIEEFVGCDNSSLYDYVPIKLTINIEACKSSYKFKVDTDFSVKIKDINKTNIRFYKLFINDKEINNEILNDKNAVLTFKENDEIYIKNIIKYNTFEDSKIEMEGIKTNEVYDIEENV